MSDTPKKKFDPNRPFTRGDGKPVGAPSVDSAQAPTVATDTEPAWYESFGRGGLQGGTLSFGDEIWGGLRAVGEALPESLGGERATSSGTLADLVNSYRRNRDEVRRNNARAEAANGGWYLGGNVLGGLATTPFMPGGAAAGAGKGLLSLMRSGAMAGLKTGASLGGIAVIGASDADMFAGMDAAPGQGAQATLGELGNLGKDATVGTLFGGAIGGTLGGLLPPVGLAGKWAWKNIGAPSVNILRGGYVTPTEEAKRLIAAGADLTLGRMDPNSAAGRLEELAATKVSGGGMDKARKATDEGVRKILVSRAGAPGEPTPAAGATTAEAVAQVKAGYNSAYDKALDGVMMFPEKYEGNGWRGVLTDDTIQGAARKKGAFELAASDRSINATETERADALKWLTDQATLLMPRQSGANAGMVEATNLQALRTRIGEEIARLKGSNKQSAVAEMQIFKRAHGFVNELLHNGLPPDASARLKAVDAVYGDNIAVQNAFNRAFKQGEAIGGGEFTPEQLLAAIDKGRGGTESFERLARDAHSVLTAKYRPTGQQVGALDVAPGASWWAQPIAQLINSDPALKAHALGARVAPGLPAKAMTALGQLGYDASMSQRTPTTVARTLYDLLLRPTQQAPALGAYGGDRDPYAVAP